MSSQASSANAESLFSNVGMSKGRKKQSTLNSTLEMTEMVLSIGKTQVEDTLLLQRSLLHSLVASFKEKVE